VIKIKEAIAKKIASMMSEDQKRQTIQAFYDTHKQDPNIDKLLQDMKNVLGYTKDDVPKR